MKHNSLFYSLISFAEAIKAQRLNNEGNFGTYPVVPLLLWEIEAGAT